MHQVFHPKTETDFPDQKKGPKIIGCPGKEYLSKYQQDVRELDVGWQLASAAGWAQRNTNPDKKVLLTALC